MSERSCGGCGSLLPDDVEVIEFDDGGTVWFFCSESCLDAFWDDDECDDDEWDPIASDRDD